MLFDGDDFNVISFMEIPGSDFNRKITTVKEGFMRGNMFNNEYKPYKNYKVKELVATNDKEEQLFRIMALSFAINDLNLLLDLNPNDRENFNTFKSLIKEKNALEQIYIEKYGPLTLEETTKNSFDWVSTFPWENEGGSKYV